MNNRFVILALLALLTMTAAHAPIPGDKVSGVNFVAPPKPTNQSCFEPLERIGAEWVALNPFAFCEPENCELKFNLDWQWWGERTPGCSVMAGQARAEGKKLLIKPHIWVRKQGWPGDYTLKTEAEWRAWEQDYERYVMALVAVAKEHRAEMFALGTEVRIAVRERPRFWKHLIRQIRTQYDGKLTYAANWDNFENVTFWADLDYIGIDAYFPLVNDEHPTVEDLMEAWEPHAEKLEAFSKSVGKPVLFTEYGYRSIGYTASAQWELPSHWQEDGVPNMDAQINAYKAVYQTFWDEPWFAGGFLWKWYPNDAKRGGLNDTDYTPQNKPVEKLIKRWYSGSQ